MYEVRVQVEFRASHQLQMYDGQLEPWHEHVWMAEARFNGSGLDRIGVLVDFVAVEQALRATVEPLDGRHLNDVPLLKDINPSAEHVARLLFEELRRRLPVEAPLAALLLREAPGCFAAYAPDG